jgi:hypothetical protein
VESTDQSDAAALDDARKTVLAAGAADLPRQPWQRGRQPSSDTELIRFAAWQSARSAGTGPAVVEAALRLLTPARAELDQVEAGLLFAARAAGLTWPQIASALALRSPQAAQQRFDRILGRVEPAAAE